MSGAEQNEKEASAPKKWVVLIGIDFYLNPPYRLRGAVRDVTSIHSYLKYRYRPDSVERFQAITTGDKEQKTPEGPSDEWPTYDNITRALQRIIDSASPGDFVYIHYSGHGALRPTDKRDYPGGSKEEYKEDFGSDAALVLYEKSSEQGIRYLRGIELAKILDKIVDKGLLLTVVLDCCHSGGISRGGKTFTSTRRMPWNNAVASEFPAQITRTSDVSRGNGDNLRNARVIDQHWLVNPQGYTLFAACGPTEEAKECEVGKHFYGALSYHLFEALSTAKSLSPHTEDGYDITFGSIYRQICAKFHVLQHNQHPVLFGREDAVFLKTIGVDRNDMSTSNAIQVTKDGSIRLDIGLAHGACLGDIYTVSPMDPINREKWQGSNEKVQVVIEEVLAFESKVNIIPPYQKEKEALCGWHAVLSQHANPKIGIKLAAEINDEWNQTIEKSPWLRSVETAEVTAPLPSFSVCIVNESDYVVMTGEQPLPLPNIPVVPIANPNAMYEVIAILEHLAKFARIEALKNSGKNQLVEIDTNQANECDSTSDNTSNDCFSITIQSKDEATKKRIDGSTLQTKHDERIRVRFKNHGERSLYLTVFNMNPLRGVSKIYPKDRGYYQEVAKSRDLNGKISFTARVAIPVKVVTQADDILKCFITNQPTATAFAALELPELPQVLAGTKRSAESDKKLLEILNSDIYNQLDGRLRHDEEDKWASRNFILQTKLSID